MVLEALSSEFRSEGPRELLYADDLAPLQRGWKSVGYKGLRVNAKKTKIMVTVTPSL